MKKLKPEPNKIMRTKHLKLAAMLLLATLNSRLSTLHAQGSLTPPGAPAPTMKTLAQIEPRTPISSAPFTITQSGSYYLTGNLTVSSGDAITIATNGVTLDLNGFTISSTAASAAGTAILFSGSNPRNLTILNGFIQGGVTNNGGGVYGGPGFAGGVFYSGTAPRNVLVSRVSVAGCLLYGIYLAGGDSTVVENCTARAVGAYGIAATAIKGSVALDCGVTAIAGDEVSDCRGETLGNGQGISATTANNCYGTSPASSGYGVAATTANNCYGYSLSGPGVSASTANNCSGASNGGSDGIAADTASNCRGTSNTGRGVFVNYDASNCYGNSIDGPGVLAANAANCHGISSTSQGVNATVASGCYGRSTANRGVSAEMAFGCYGYCGGGSFGVKATSVANSCYGFSSAGTGVAAYIVNSCVGATTTGSAVGFNFKYNMP